jgi:hypothetical protein
MNLTSRMLGGKASRRQRAEVHRDRRRPLQTWPSCMIRTYWKQPGCRRDIFWLVPLRDDTRSMPSSRA